MRRVAVAVAVAVLALLVVGCSAVEQGLNDIDAAIDECGREYDWIYIAPWFDRIFYPGHELEETQRCKCKSSHHPTLPR